MLTKKHFVAIAEILGQHSVETSLVDSFVSYFETQNPKFQEDSFRNYIDDVQNEIDYNS